MATLVDMLLCALSYTYTYMYCPSPFPSLPLPPPPSLQLQAKNSPIPEQAEGMACGPSSQAAENKLSAIINLFKTPFMKRTPSEIHSATISETDRQKTLAPFTLSGAQVLYMYMYNTCSVHAAPVRGSSVFTVYLRTMPYFVLPSFAYTCTRFDHVHVFIQYMYSVHEQYMYTCVYTPTVCVLVHVLATCT